MPYRFFHSTWDQNPGVRVWRAEQSSSAFPAILRVIFVVAVAMLLMDTSLRAATSTTVIGTITYRNGKPAVNVFVSIGGRYRYTDVSGRYKIEGVPQGVQHMTIKSGRNILLQEDVNISGSMATVNRVLP
jgi:hypothetical protein